jgi:hypothetical protein
MKSNANYIRDEGRPLGVGLQDQASNRSKLRRLRVVVVNVGGKVAALTAAGAIREDERK